MSSLQHEPSEKTRELVTALAVNGVQQSRIAAYIGIPERMLRRHYRDTLDLAKERACAQAANNLFRITSTGSGMAAVFAAIYIGARGGWRDMSRTELQIEPKSPKGLTGLLQLVRADGADSDAKADSAGIRVLTTKGKHDDNTVWDERQRTQTARLRQL